MKENFIQLEKDNILRLGIKDSEGNDTGEHLEFDLEDIELPLRYQELIEEEKKSKSKLKNDILIIEKRQDVKGKKLMSKNEEDKIKALNEFYKRQVKIYDMFLGENGVQKLLNGRKVGWTSLEAIDKIISEQIAPHLQVNMNDITEKIKSKYGKEIIKNDEVLK